MLPLSVITPLCVLAVTLALALVGLNSWRHGAEANSRLRERTATVTDL